MTLARSLVLSLGLLTSSYALADGSTPPPPGLQNPTLRNPFIVNPDFELGTQGNGMPAGWAPAGSGYNIFVVSGVAASGYHSIQMTRATNTANFGGVGQCVSAASFHNRLIRLSGALATNSVYNGYAGLWLRVDGMSNEVLFLDNMSQRPVYGTTPWTYYQVQAFIPTNALRVCFGAISTGLGVAYADAFSLTPSM